jgi:hypothetical protein
MNRDDEKGWTNSYEKGDDDAQLLRKLQIRERHAMRRL